MEQLLAYRNFMIGVFLWITTWDVFRSLVHSFAFGKKHYVLIFFIILITLTVYTFNSDTISWVDLQ